MPGVLAPVMSINRVLRASGSSEQGMFSPEAIVFGLGLPLALGAIALAWIQYRRGGLDLYDVRRRRSR